MKSFVAVSLCIATLELGMAYSQQVDGRLSGSISGLSVLAFQTDTDFAWWQNELRAKLAELLALPTHRRALTDVTRSIDQENDKQVTCRIGFRSDDEIVPGYLIVPKGVIRPPVMICLQGHSPEGVQVSIGRVPVRGGRDFAAQAVIHGWAALALEQRSFGERGNNRGEDALHGILLGKPLDELRVLDVMYAIDFIESQDDLDASRIASMGNSMGGAISFYAACVDPRLRMAVASCSFCTYEGSWLRHRHCPCGYIPGIAGVADMGDLAGLIAPRDLIVVAGAQDATLDIDGVKNAYAIAKRPFRATGAEESVNLVIGARGHQFYAEQTWPIISARSALWSSVPNDIEQN